MTEKKVSSQTKLTKTQDDNTKAMLTYLAGWITGLIFLLTEKEDQNIRFHAAQSVVVFGVLNLIAMVPLIGWMLTPIVSLIAIALWILLMLKAYQGEKFVLPVAGEYAQRLMKLIK